MKIKFVPKDIWIGLYYDRKIDWQETAEVTTTYYLCLIPCLPIIWTRNTILSLATAKQKYCRQFGNAGFEKSWLKRTGYGEKQ